MKRNIFCATAFAAVLVTTAASAEVYKCTVEQNGVIPPVILISEKGGVASVFDGVIDEVYGDPIEAKVS